MFLHLGENTLIRISEIVGIFDLEITSQAKKTREFLTRAEKARRVINVSTELPRSFIVYNEAGETRTYISQISPKTLQIRAEKTELYDGGHANGRK